MKGTSNEGFQGNFINKSFANLASPIIKDTGETDAIQYSKSNIPLESRSADTDEIEVLRKHSLWEQMSDDKVRLLLTLCVIGLFMISIIIGLVLFIVIRNTWLLFGVPVLVIPTYKVIGYYFYRPKEK